MKRKIKNSEIALLFLLAFILLAGWINLQAQKQAELDYTLVVALKGKEDKQALAALEKGASGEARETGKAPTSWEALLGLLRHVIHPGRRNATEEHIPALLLYYHEFGRDSSTPNIAVVRALLEHGARITDRDEKGNTPLLLACCHPDSDMLRLILAQEAEVNVMNEDGE